MRVNRKNRSAHPHSLDARDNTTYEPPTVPYRPTNQGLFAFVLQFHPPRSPSSYSDTHALIVDYHPWVRFGEEPQLSDSVPTKCPAPALDY